MSSAPVGILLAAGKGRRFDPSGQRNKLLRPLANGEPVAVASARTLLAVLPKVIAVVRPGDDALAALLRDAGCDVTVCPDADEGMAHSLVHAVHHSLPGAGSWLIALGDMPHVRAATIVALSDALNGGAVIAAPVSAGRRGNPVAFDLTCLADLLALKGDQGARGVLMRHAVTEVQVDDPGIFEDIDRPSDL